MSRRPCSAPSIARRSPASRLSSRWVRWSRTDTVIGIIEVMKLMNSVRAGVRGEVVEIFAQNGALVEYEEPLIRVRPAG